MLAPEEENPVMQSEYPSPRFKVLYVDDEAKALKYFSKALSPELDVITAISADEALEILNKQGDEIGVLATDQRMPKTRGIDLLKITRARWPNLVSILITAYSNVDDIIDSINQGHIFQYVRKPWNPDKLKIKLLEALQEHSRNKFNSQLEKANKELEQAYETQSKFISMLSHEVRTPVNISTSLSERLLQMQLTDEQREHIESIKVANDNLANLLNNTLDYSKWSAGELTLSNIDFQLDVLIHDASNVFKLQAKNAGLKYHVHITPEAKSAYRGDPDKVSQVLLNLISNAIKFTPKGGEINVRASQTELTGSKATVLFSVTNTGEGISPEVRNKLFTPYYQSQPGKGGTGLGLSISKELVSMMGGQIGLNSDVGKGSEFWFSVELETLSSFQYDSSRKTSSSRVPILLVDDSILYQTLVQSLLVDEGYTVDISENGHNALERAKEKQYALILMDCQMPLMDGFETTMKIRANSLNKNTPIIALTAMTGKSLEDKLKESGMNDYMSKPFKTFVFLETLNHWTKDFKIAAEG